MFEKLKKLLKKGENKMADLDKMLESLSDEEKKELKAKLDSLYKAEEVEEVDKVEEEQADETETVAEEVEEVKEETNEAEETVDAPTEEVEVQEETEVTEQVAEEQGGGEDRIAKLEEQMGKIIELLTKKEGVEAKSEEVYGLGNGVFQDENKAPETKKVSASEIAQLLAKIKR